jgi:hypothetical protein
MKNKTLLFTILSAQFFIACAQTKNPPYVCKEFKYDSVVAYECKKNIKGMIVMNTKLYTKIINKAKQLSKPQIDTLHAFLWQLSTSDKTLKAECWYPYLGIVYYLKGHDVANFSISKECDVFLIYFRVLSNPTNWPNSRLSFSEPERKRITTLCAELGFTYY